MKSVRKIPIYWLWIILFFNPAGCGGGEGGDDVGVDFDVTPHPDADAAEDTAVDDSQADTADVIPEDMDWETGDPPRDAPDRPDLPSDPDASDWTDIPPTCGNGTLDPGEDCDGDPPEACSTSCGSTGTRTCTSICTWSTCAPPDETCNGLDDDCDGIADEDFDCAAGAAVDCTTSCLSTGTGTCTDDCRLPGPEGCTPPAESCNGLDDDCDTVCDNGFECCRGETEDCTTPGGFPGTRTCSSTCEWEDCAIECPPECRVIPTGGAIGASCVSDASCRSSLSCWPEEIEFFNGETYTSFPGGQCVIYGSGTSVCDPDDPASCPAGSTCVYLGSSMGIDFHGCYDTCIPHDSSDRPYDFNCGCRERYACGIVSEICMSGCSNNRECCERWWDLNGDYTRQAGEIVVKPGCTNTCDDSPPGFCEASYQCINNGDAANVWSGPCEGDAWCPPDGRCLDEFHYTDDGGVPYFPGGLCIKDACNLVGRGCSAHDGGCTNLGSSSDPFWACAGKCHFGRNLLDADYECRTTRDEEHACMPVEPETWHSPPADGSDGICWPGNFPGGAHPLGDSCTADAQCESPYGLGFCMSFSDITAAPFCSGYCIQASAENFAVCGSDNGSGTALGVCYTGVCWEGCDTPGGNLGTNGCTLPTLACYFTASLGTVYKDIGSAMPAGTCIPACTDNSWCLDFWGLPMVCNTLTGVCG